MNKRYAIVRVDDKSDNNCKNCEMLYTNDNGNNDCRLRIGASFLCYRYGDTKEQMVKKVAQVFFRRKLKVYKEILGGEILSKKYLKRIYEKYLETAKEIVEFLGVK